MAQGVSWLSLLGVQGLHCVVIWAFTEFAILGYSIGQVWLEV